MIIDCHGHYTTAPGAAEVPRRADRGAEGAGEARSRWTIRTSPTTRSARASRARSSSSSASAAPISRSSRRAPRPWPTTSATRRRACDWTRAMQRPHPPRLRALSRELRRRVPAAAVARRAAGELRSPSSSAASRSSASSAATSIPTRPAATGGPAADRPLLVSALREDGRAGRARDGPRQLLVQSRISTPPARTTSMPTRRRSCSSSRATCSRIFRRCGSSFRTAAARCRSTGAAIAAWRRT